MRQSMAEFFPAQLITNRIGNRANYLNADGCNRRDCQCVCIRNSNRRIRSGRAWSGRRIRRPSSFAPASVRRKRALSAATRSTNFDSARCSNNRSISSAPRPIQFERSAAATSCASFSARSERFQWLVELSCDIAQFSFPQTFNNLAHMSNRHRRGATYWFGHR